MARVWPFLILCGALSGCASTVSIAPADGGSFGVGDGAPLDASADRALDATARDVVVPPDDVETLPETAAEAVCSAMFRCCGSEGRARYFEPLQWNGRVPPELMRSIPPVDEAACRRIVAEALRVAVFPDWIDAVRRGQVEYVAEGSLECRRTLLNAPCGNLVTSTLLDPRCFSLMDSSLGRGMFRPVARDGDACRAVRESRYPIRFYGSCDPDAAFCCLPDPADPTRCLDSFEADRMHVTEGRCRRAAARGESCNSDSLGGGPGMWLCQRELVCGLASRTCLTSDHETELGLGAPCYDPYEGRGLGRCPYDQGLWCDLFRLMGEGTATDTCVELHANGRSCTRNSECLSYSCVEGVCHAAVPLCGES